MSICHKLSSFAGGLLLATILTCQAGDQIQVYTVPKEHLPAQFAQAQPAMDPSGIPVNSAPIHWTLPDGWKQMPPDGIRRASFEISTANGGIANVAITSFPGSVGTELGNVNRWRGELGLEPIGESDLASEPVTVDSFQGKLYDMTGAKARTVVAEIPCNGNSWFIKLRGDTAAVTAAKPVFLEFLKTIYFGGRSAEPNSASGLAMQASANPHERPAPPEGPSDGPKWNVPAQWVESTPSPMILKSFSVGDATAGAAVTISAFPGEVGGVLANINRWRGQIGLPPVTQENQLNGLTEPLVTLAGKAILTDMVGTDTSTGQPERLIAAIVPHDGKTWFYKLMGNSKVVEGQKNTFVEFVKTVQYP